MAKSIQSIIMSVIIHDGTWVSPGELFSQSQEEGYKGTQKNLIQKANELASKGVIESQERGRMQNTWYRRIPILDSAEPADKAIDDYVNRPIRCG